MKQVCLRLLTTVIVAVTLLLPTSCRRTLDYQLESVLPSNYQPPAQGTIKIDGPVVLNGRLFVIDSTSADQVVSLSGDKLVLKAGVRLRSGRTTGGEGVNELQPGDIIASDVSAATPRGMLKKVKDKLEVGGEVTMTVEDATFEGLFKKVNFTIEGEVAPSVSLERTLSAENGPLSGSLALKGSFKPSGMVRVELRVNDATVQHALTSVTFKRSVTMGLTAAGAVTLARDIELLRQSLPTIRVVIPVPTPVGIPLPLPVLLTPDFVATVKVAAGVQGAFEASLLNFSDSFTYGVSYDLGVGRQIIKTETPAQNNPSFEFKTSGSAEMSLRPELEFSFYDWKGFTFGLGTELYGKVEAACKSTLSQTPKPEDKNVLELKLSAGLRADLFAQWKFFSPALTNEATVQGRLEFAVVAKQVQSDWCGSASDPLPNDTKPTSVAVSTGDPHLSTFDRLGYSFQAVGEFVAVKATPLGSNFEIQVRQEPRANSTQVSLNTGLAIRTGSGNEVVCVYPNRVFLNGQNIGIVSGERPLANGGKLIGSTGTLTVRTGLGDEINIQFFGTTLDYTFTLASARRGQVKGLMGNYDGLSTNDLLRGDTGAPVPNTYEALYPAYANSWRIRQAESLFVYDVGKTTDSYTDREFPRSTVALTAQQRSAAEAVCRAAGVTDPQALSNCIVDVALTNDRSFAQRSLAFQLANAVLTTFSIGEFSTSDVQLDYYGATAQQRAAVLNTQSLGFSRVVMKQGVALQRGFTTEFDFSTAELNAKSCFFLALWPTDTKTRSTAQKRVGFCFGQPSGTPLAFFTFDNGNAGSQVLAQKDIPNFIDGRTHKVRIAERLLTSGRWRVEVFLDNPITPVYFVDNVESIADIIDAFGNTGYIEFQINEGAPSEVKLFNWQYNAL